MNVILHVYTMSVLFADDFSRGESGDQGTTDVGRFEQ
jgi:hypothetical protein